MSHDRQLLASCSLDDIVKIIDVSNLGSRIKEQFDEEAYERDLVDNPKIKKKRKHKKGGDDEEMKDDNDDEDDSNSDWESEDSDDSDSEEEEKKEGKKDK